jgi:hypothetical protein
MWHNGMWHVAVMAVAWRVAWRCGVAWRRGGVWRMWHVACGVACGVWHVAVMLHRRNDIVTVAYGVWQRHVACGMWHVQRVACGMWRQRRVSMWRRNGIRWLIKCGMWHVSM